MEVDKVKTKQQVEDITCLVETIFGCDLSSISVKEKGSWYEIKCVYKNYSVSVSREYDIRDRYYCLNICIIYRDDPFAEETPFWQLYAYYDNKTSCFKLDKDNLDNNKLREVLTKLKEYFDTGRFFYAATDIKNQKRYFVLEGKRIDLPYAISLRTEDERKFGKEGKRMKYLRSELGKEFLE